jgi:hypothetical protein
MAAWMLPAAIFGSALLGGSSSRSAASTQAAAADRAAELQNQQFNRQVELQEPFRQVGLRALNKLEGASDYTPFGMDQFQQDPGYAFRLSEGMKTLERGAAARGNLMSGATMKGLQRYGQDLASQEYTNAFNRYGIERERRLNPLQSLAGVGQTSTNQLAAAGQNYANAAGQAIGAAGQARASGYMGTANSLSGALGQYMNYNQQQQQNELVNQLMNRNAGIYGSIGTGGGYGGGVTNFSDFDGS